MRPFPAILVSPKEPRGVIQREIDLLNRRELSGYFTALGAAARLQLLVRHTVARQLLLHWPGRYAGAMSLQSLNPARWRM
jgi:hypothetical protein